jgi:hypothetical protein
VEAKELMDRVEKWTEQWWSGTMEGWWAADGGLGATATSNQARGDGAVPKLTTL